MVFSIKPSRLKRRCLGIAINFTFSENHLVSRLLWKICSNCFDRLSLWLPLQVAALNSVAT